MSEGLAGYVYILEVADIDLPVCKIGMTTRDPISRCQEINKSSTGDFIWSVAYSLAVDDCKALERLIHLKLHPLRQKKREFFNLGADDAYKAMMSIFEFQNEIKIINKLVFEAKPEIPTRKEKNKKDGYKTRHDAIEYTALLQHFCEILGVKGRPFGQLNKAYFGMSDGNEGVQWNISISPKENHVRVGVNLEGKAYKNWPISQLIKSEIMSPRLHRAIGKTNSSDEAHLTFWRDAWQVASRPEIKEKYIGGREFRLSELTSEKWQCVLREALECLDEKHDYRKRNTQSVTVIKKNGTATSRIMQVSPHLTIWSPLVIDDNIERAVGDKINELASIYRWMMELTE